MYPTCEGERGQRQRGRGQKEEEEDGVMKERKCKGREVLVCLLCLMTMSFIVQALSKDAIGMECANALY